MLEDRRHASGERLYLSVQHENLPDVFRAIGSTTEAFRSIVLLAGQQKHCGHSVTKWIPMLCVDCSYTSWCWDPPGFTQVRHTPLLYTSCLSGHHCQRPSDRRGVRVGCLLVPRYVEDEGNRAYNHGSFFAQVIRHVVPRVSSLLSKVPNS